MEEQLVQVSAPILSPPELAHLVDRYIRDLLSPELLGVHKAILRRPGAIILHDHARHISRSCRLHDASSFGLEVLLGIPVDESVQE